MTLFFIFKYNTTFIFEDYTTDSNVTNEDNSLTSILLGVFLPIIFIGLIVFGVLYLIRTKKIKYFKNKLRKQVPFDDEIQIHELNSENKNEMKFYGANSNTNNEIIE